MARFRALEIGPAIHRHRPCVPGGGPPISCEYPCQVSHAVPNARDDDAWRLRLARLRPQIGDDGVERITTQVVLDVLEVPQSRRRAGTYRRLAKLIAELGWTGVRVRGLTRGGYVEQIRDFAKSKLR